MKLTYKQKENLQAVLSYGFKTDYKNIIIDSTYIEHDKKYKISFKCKRLKNIDNYIYKYNNTDILNFYLIINLDNKSFILSIKNKEDVNQISLFEEENNNKELYTTILNKCLNSVVKELHKVEEMLFKTILDNSATYNWTFYFIGNNNLYFSNKDLNKKSIKVTPKEISNKSKESEVYNNCYVFTGTENDSNCMVLRRNISSNIVTKKYNNWHKCKLNTPLNQLFQNSIKI